MPGDATLSGAIGYFLWFLGELVFKWVPGIAISVAGPSNPAFEGAFSPQVPAITSAVTPGQVIDYLQAASAPGVYDRLFTAWRTLVGVSVFLSLIFGALLIYSFIRIVQHRRAHYRHIEHLQHSVAAADVPVTHLRWDRVMEQAYSENEQAWRLAILEADIMLGELLDFLGYRGATMADKMRQVEKGDFKTIDLAWEAHRTRNKIAHEGAAHEISAREARRIITLYEQIFREFQFVR